MMRLSTQDAVVDLGDRGGKVLGVIHNSHGVPDA